MDMQILQNQIAGLIAQGKELRNKQYLFIEAKGLDKSIAQSGKDLAEKEAELEKVKADLKTAVDQKNAAVAATTKALAEKMGEILPEGEAVFNIDEGKVFLGWNKDGKTRAHAGISGGEKVTFDSALTNALGCGVLITEGAEIDRDQIYSVIAMLSEVDAQVILNTCHGPKEAPENWNVGQMG